MLLQVKSVASRRGIVGRPTLLPVTDPLKEPTYKVGTDVSTWPYSKHARAIEHINRLRSDVQLWLAEQPVGTEGVLADDRLSWTLEMVVRDRAPVHRWSTIIGDCVHNLRSALDSAVWEFATLNGAKPSRPNLVQFPVVERPERWTEAVGTRLQCVPHEVVERIRITQPLMRPEDERPRDPLVLLQHLSNTDKHRASITCGFHPESVNADFSVEFEDEEAASRNVPPDVTLHGITMEEGAVLIEYRTKDPIRATKGGFALTFELLLDTPSGPQKLFDTIEGLIQFVGQVLAVLHGGAVREADPPTGSD